MGGDLPNVDSLQRVFDREEVERYFAEYERERARLTGEILDARARISRARAALIARETMERMLADAFDEITARRRQADILLGRLTSEADAPIASPPTEVEVVQRGVNGSGAEERQVLEKVTAR